MATPPVGGTEPSPAPGLLQSLRSYLRNWVQLLQTRLELFSTEFAEERERVLQILVWGAAAAVCLLCGVLLVTLFIVVLFWETNYRLVVLGGFALIYLGVGATMGVVTRRKCQQRPKILAATLGELEKDLRHLSSRT